MTAQQNRRDFLRQGINIGAGLICCCGSFSCRKRSQSKKSSKKEVSQTKPAGEDFSKLSYCGLACGPNCKIFAATKNNDYQSKVKIADEWSAKYGKSFKPEDVHCSGCKAENMPASYYASICEIRKCAKEKQVMTCAHCSDFPACKKQTWTDWPTLREKIEQIRSKLQTQDANNPK